jgi:hypothetical protein
MRARRRRFVGCGFVCLLATVGVAWDAALTSEAPALLEAGLTITRLKTVVTLCHRPPENPGNAQTITVGPSAVAAHVAHGDSLGECPACQAGVPSPVPKTGQTTCWGEGGSPIDCAGTGQDGAHQKGVSADPRFTDNGNGTVTDNLTGLIWLKDAGCLEYMDWTSALSAANGLSAATAPLACGLTDGSMAGDWRLPNVKELQSLIDYGQALPALPVGHPFTGMQYGLYCWSSTTYVNGANVVWLVDLAYGFVYTDGKDDFLSVCPVRGGQ